MTSPQSMKRNILVRSCYFMTIITGKQLKSYLYFQERVDNFTSRGVTPRIIYDYFSIMTSIFTKYASWNLHELQEWTKNELL